MKEESCMVFGFKKDKPEELLAHKVSGCWEDRNNLDWKQRRDTDSIVQKKARQWAEENLDTFALQECRFSVCYAIEHDVENNKVNVYVDEYWERLIEEMAMRSSEIMFTYDGKIERIDAPSWKNRGQAEDRREAIKYLARAISMGFPKSSAKLEMEMVGYAAKHEIPFEVDLFKQAGTYFNSLDCPSWDTSSKYC